MNKEPKQIQSAGGIITKQVADNRLILMIIHKKGGYAIPKGKTRKTETLEEAALREMSEETGLNTLSITKKLGVIYKHRPKKNKVKHIHVYKMNYLIRRHFISDEAIEWVEFSKAINNMHFEEEKEFLLDVEKEIFS